MSVRTKIEIGRILIIEGGKNKGIKLIKNILNLNI